MKTETELKKWRGEIARRHEQKVKFLQDNVIQLSRPEEMKVKRDILALENDLTNVRNGLTYLEIMKQQNRDPFITLQDQKIDLEALIARIENTIDKAVMTQRERLLNKQKQTGHLKQKLNTINFLLS
jgi:predicted  nucleic acid-binding Zn-ribbon protein